MPKSVRILRLKSRVTRWEQSFAYDQDGVELLKWAETYWNRQTPSSFAGHSRMFSNFSGTKFRLENREQATLLLADLRACTIALKGDE
jgi:hypothetical protein